MSGDLVDQIVATGLDKKQVDLLPTEDLPLIFTLAIQIYAYEIDHF